MCLPVPGQKGAHSQTSQEGGGELPSDQTGRVGGGLADLHGTRDQVVAEVRKAPKRRVDNMITRLVDSVNLLQMHATVGLSCLSFHSHQCACSELNCFL